MKGYPRWFLPALLAALQLMFITGILLAPTTLALRADIGVPWRLPGTARVLTAALHAAGGFALMLLTGALWSQHMRTGWRRRRQRASGLVLALLLLLLAASAVAVYYLGDETLARAAAFTHLGAGLLLAGPLGWHWVFGRHARRHPHLEVSLPAHRHAASAARRHQRPARTELHS